MEPSPRYISYTVRPGDSLSKIMEKAWGVQPHQKQRREAALAHLLAINPEIKNPDRIHPGQTLRLKAMTPPELDMMCRARPTPRSRHRLDPVIPMPSDPKQREAFWALSWLEHNTNWLSNPGSVLTGAAGNLFHPVNNQLVAEVEDIYNEYKAGSLTKGQYDYRRQKLLKEFARRIGPMENILFGGRTAPEAIRIAQSGGVPATDNIARHTQRLNRLSKLARGGGILLTGVGLYAGCQQIGSAETQEEKNEIFVETAGSTIIGGAAGVGVSLFLTTNPVGWGVSLILAAGTVATGYGAGKGLRSIYDKAGHPVDFVGATGTEDLCR